MCVGCQPTIDILDVSRMSLSFGGTERGKVVTTSKKEASKAGKRLRDPKTPKKDRGPIASDLAQAKRQKRRSSKRSSKRR